MTLKLVEVRVPITELHYIGWAKIKTNRRRRQTQTNIYIMEIANITHKNSSSNGSSISRQNLYTYEVILNLSTISGAFLIIQ